MSTPDSHTAPAQRTPRRHRRLLPIALILLLIALAASTGRVLLGTPMVAPADALAVLRGELVPGISFIVMDSRLPAVAVGALAGISFGVSGTVFQTLLRNPLASPDVLGVTLGASAGTVVAMTVFTVTDSGLFWAALFGGIGTAVLVLLVASSRRGRDAGRVDDRFVLVGIGVAAALSALITFLLTRIDPRSAGDLMRWLIGSLNASTWDCAVVLAGAVVVLAPVVALLASRLRILELGDDLATALGLPVPLTRTALILVAVVLAALPVAVTGPLAFIAFLAGPIARALLGRPSLFLSALTGAVLVLCADLIGQNAFGSTPMPVGVITGAFGAPFLLWMMTRGGGPGQDK